MFLLLKVALLSVKQLSTNQNVLDDAEPAGSYL